MTFYNENIRVESTGSRDWGHSPVVWFLGSNLHLENLKGINDYFTIERCYLLLD